MKTTLGRTAVTVACALALALGGCGEKKDRSPADDHGHEHAGAGGAAAKGAADHGTRRELGTVKLLETEFAVALLGDLKAGAEGAFEVRLTTGAPSGQRPILWVEDAGGAQVGGPENGSVEGGAWHFHVTPRAGSTPTRVVLRLRQGDKDERAGLPLDGHGHEHPATPHDGVVAKVKDASGRDVGFVELKLHDDKGDLELWFGQDERFETPLDLPVDAVPSVTFVDAGGRSVELRVRDATTNPDEDGKANVRAGRTNYFVFPGDTGADASWLTGREFRSLVSVKVSSGDSQWDSEEFVLKPHTHDGGGH